MVSMRRLLFQDIADGLIVTYDSLLPVWHQGFCCCRTALLIQITGRRGMNQYLKLTVNDPTFCRNIRYMHKRIINFGYICIAYIILLYLYSLYHITD